MALLTHCQCAGPLQGPASIRNAPAKTKAWLDQCVLRYQNTCKGSRALVPKLPSPNVCRGTIAQCLHNMLREVDPPCELFKNPTEKTCCEPTCATYSCSADGWVKKADSDDELDPSDSKCCEATCVTYSTCTNSGWVQRALAQEAFQVLA